MEFKDLSKEQITRIVKLAFKFSKHISSDLEITYWPYIKEHFEDAREYFCIKFNSDSLRKNPIKNKIEITPELDIFRWSNDKPCHVLNQYQIQELLAHWGVKPDYTK